MTNKKITLIELDSKTPNLGKMIAMPRLGITAIGSILSRENDVKVLADCYRHVSLDEVLATNPDIIMFNGMQTSLNRIRELAGKIKAILPNVPIVVGGEQATQNPASVKDFSDFIVLNEGDESVRSLVDSWDNPERLSSIPGIMFKQDGQWQTTEKADRVRNIDFRLNPGIIRGMGETASGLMAKILNITPGLRYLSFPIQTSRGCYKKCSFCTTEALFGSREFHTRSIDDVLSDIDAVIGQGISHVNIVDNLFGGNKRYAIELLKRMKERYSGKITAGVLMRADQFDSAKTGSFSSEELALMKQAGISTISIGVESINPETLKRIAKEETIAQYENAIRAIKKAGIDVTATFGVGGGEDTVRDMQEIISFARKNKINCVNLYAFTIAPGTEEARQNSHLIIPGVSDDLVNGHAVTTLPRKMLPSQLQEGILDAMGSFYSWTNPTGIFHKIHLRRIRDSLSGHLANLKSMEKEMIEKGIYSQVEGNWQLNEEALKANPIRYSRVSRR
jgi:radical SAM superfamily enzyme YgiQ (UPF0313 family)